MINSVNRGSILDRLVLNQVQREAASYDKGPQLVFAGAGTGKTRVLTAKICFLIEMGISPSGIFAATFTNKAAREMRSRVEEYLGRSCNGMWIGTFHSLCTRILRNESAVIGFRSSFTIYDTDDQLVLIKRVMKKLEIDDRSASPRALLGKISRLKNNCKTPRDASNEAVGYSGQELVNIYKSYQRALTDQDAMDFDDLIMLTVMLFRSAPEILQKYQSYFKYFLIDEFQDTNTSQFELVKLLAKNSGKIFAVGDDDQSIYSWRGAQVKNILSFEQEFKDTRVFKLEQNYRSTTKIIDFANAVIAENTDRAPKQLWSDRKDGEQVIVSRYRDDRQEAEIIAVKVRKLIDKNTRGTEIAILFRTNAQSRSFEESFRKYKIPYVLVGGMSFYERMEIKDCIAFLRLLVNPRDAISFERIYNKPARGLGEKALETLSEKASGMKLSLLETLLVSNPEEFGSRSRSGFSELKSMFELLISLYKSKESLVEILKQALDLSGYWKALDSEDSVENESRKENIEELGNALAIWEKENSDKDLAAFLEEIALVSDVDAWDKKDQAVNMMTMHSAKGLEFSHVFLVGIEDGIIPSKQNFDNESSVEEERRLFYVGATRAIDSLECSYAERRLRFGQIQIESPSRFLEDIPPALYQYNNSSFLFDEERRVEIAEVRKAPAAAAAMSRPKVVKQPSRAEYDDFEQPPSNPSYSQDTVEFRIGQHVKHKVHGPGRVLSISGFGNDMKLTVLFNNGKRLKLMAKFAVFE
ncbi:MAG TPA: UvrD-helicase domain-containing protein [Chitinispirillaceae bacterium]|nr:UvrD-helicase domain-containing protein [Chitinispirillaceae bacterium]